MSSDGTEPLGIDVAVIGEVMVRILQVSVNGFTGTHTEFFTPGWAGWLTLRLHKMYV
jgi:hypothetical protein